MLLHFTVMPVLFVNSSSDAFGGGSEARATVMVTPVVAVEAALEPPLELPLPHAASARLSPVAPTARQTLLAPIRIEVISCRLPSEVVTSGWRSETRLEQPLCALRA